MFTLVCPLQVSYFHKEPPSKIIIPQKDPKSQLPNDANRPTKLKVNKRLSSADSRNYFCVINIVTLYHRVQSKAKHSVKKL